MQSSQQVISVQLDAGPYDSCSGDATFGTIVRKLEDAFVRHYRHRPGVGEVRSWQNSLARRVREVDRRRPVVLDRARRGQREARRRGDLRQAAQPFGRDVVAGFAAGPPS